MIRLSIIQKSRLIVYLIDLCLCLLKSFLCSDLLGRSESSKHKNDWSVFEQFDLSTQTLVLLRFLRLHQLLVPLGQVRWDLFLGQPWKFFWEKRKNFMNEVEKNFSMMLQRKTFPALLKPIVTSLRKWITERNYIHDDIDDASVIDPSSWQSLQTVVDENRFHVGVSWKFNSKSHGTFYVSRIFIFFIVGHRDHKNFSSMDLFSPLPEMHSWSFFFFFCFHRNYWITRSYACLVIDCVQVPGGETVKSEFTDILKFFAINFPFSDMDMFRWWCPKW